MNLGIILGKHRLRLARSWVMLLGIILGKHPAWLDLFGNDLWHNPWHNPRQTST